MVRIGLNSDVTTLLILADVHVPLHDVRALSAVEQFMPDLKPDVLVYLGDFLDMTSVNHWLHEGNNRRELEGRRLCKEYEEARTLIRKHYELCWKPQVIYFYGNHEMWIQRYVNQHPELEGMLEPHLHLGDDPPIVFVKENDVVQAGKLYLLHGIWTNKYHSNKHVTSYHRNLVYGHCHTLQVFTEVTPLSDDAHAAYSIPSLCDSRQMSYIANKPTAAVTGFAVAYVMKNGYFNLYPVVINRGRFVWNGKVYG